MSKHYMRVIDASHREDVQMASPGLSPPHFKLRVAGICLQEGYALLQQFDGASFWCLPGGSVEMLESSIDALQREWREELHESIIIDRLTWIVEAVYSTLHTTHEVGFYYQVSLHNDSSFVDKTTLYVGADGGAPFKLKWFPLAALRDTELYPAF